MIGSFLTVLMAIRLVLLMSIISQSHPFIAERERVPEKLSMCSRSQEGDRALQRALVKVTLLIKMVEK